jgi:WhiB family redox-sensing transcriptional regulator
MTATLTRQPPVNPDHRPTDDGPRWRRRVACAGHDPELWWPIDFRSLTAELALAICKECPVRQACLELAIRNQETAGIWGGMWPHERAEYARERGLTPARPLASAELEAHLPQVQESTRHRTVRAFAAAGATTEDIAVYFRVKPETVDRWLRTLARADAIREELAVA